MQRRAAWKDGSSRTELIVIGFKGLLDTAQLEEIFTAALMAEVGSE